jgi:hypothetical protein
MLRIVEKSVPTHQMLPLPLTHINRVKKTGKHKAEFKIVLYAPTPVFNAFDAGSIHYEGK